MGADYVHEDVCGGGWRDTKVLCDKQVTMWRACGRGCADKVSRAYCKAHGGDERAQREMDQHHRDHDRQETL